MKQYLIFIILLIISIIGLVFISPAYAAGTGTIISNDGYILTNKHVANNDTAKFNNYMFFLINGYTYKAKFITSPGDIDLALFKVESDIRLPCSQFGTSDPIKSQELIVHMFNFIKRDYSFKSVSVPHAYIIHDQKDNISVLSQRAFSFENIVRPGNSGSPIFNSEEKIVGIVFANYPIGKMVMRSYALYLTEVIQFIKLTHVPLSCSGTHQNTVGWLY
jgi:putative serine protease PepD